MKRVYNFSEFTQIFESSTSESNIIIGDSTTPMLASLIKNVRLLGKKGSEDSLWKGGMGVKWLKNAVDQFGVSPSVKNVVINIGTNGGFNPNDDIKGLFSSLKRVFPSARFIVIQGSWGWGGNKNVTEDKVRRYYQKFANEGGIVIDPPEGYVATDALAHSHLPSQDAIAKAINSLLAGQNLPAQNRFSVQPEQKTQDNTDGSSPDDVKKFQNWLDSNKPGWAWGYPGGIVNRAGGYGKFGPRTTKAWADYKKEYISSGGGVTPGGSSSDKKEDSQITQKSVGNFGKFTVPSNRQSPLIFVYGGIKVGGRQSGDYMYDYLKNIQNKSSLFVAKNPNVPGVESFQSVLNQSKAENLSPNKKILYLFSGGYLPGKAVIEKYGANFFDKIYLVDIWMGNSSVAEFYKNLSFKYPNKIEYYYTSSGSANPSAAKEIANRAGLSKKVETSRGQGNTHMATNLDAVESLEKYIK